ncbi:hypothetical protein Q1695_004955 [Nippostrongylus brasiliensis]|nr:hypothetical protein Q1695_004955 [Nippostrongylus brasiliensis]
MAENSPENLESLIEQFLILSDHEEEIDEQDDDVACPVETDDSSEDNDDKENSNITDMRKKRMNPGQQILMRRSGTLAYVFKWVLSNCHPCETIGALELCLEGTRLKRKS